MYFTTGYGIGDERTVRTGTDRFGESGKGGPLRAMARVEQESVKENLDCSLIALLERLWFVLGEAGSRPAF